MWHRFSLRELLIEDKYSFSGKAGSTGGLVSKALFTFCPTIKVGDIALDGQDSTDMQIQIGKGYKVIDVHGDEATGYVPATEPTSAQPADVEIGFESKRIFIGSVEAGGYLGTTIKPNTVWEPQKIGRFSFQRRTNGLRRRLNRLQGVTLDFPRTFDVVVDEDSLYGGPYGNPFNKPMAPKKFVESVLEGISSLSWTVVESDQWRVREMRNGVERYQGHPQYEQINEIVENFISTIQGKEAYGTQDDEIQRLWSMGVQGVDWDGNRRRPGVVGKRVSEAESQGTCYWLQFKPQSNHPEMKSTIASHGAWQSSSDAWEEVDENRTTKLPVPSDIDRDILVLKGSARSSDPYDGNSLPGAGGSGLTEYLNNPELKVSAEEQIEIWTSTGDDYFVFLDVQSGDETARIVRSKNAPIPGIGHWSAQAIRKDELIDKDGKPYSTNRVSKAVPPEAVFEVTEDGEVVSIPELEVKVIPLLSKVVKNDLYFTGKYQSPNGGRVDLYLSWDDWNWETAEAYPFNPRMMKIMKKYEVKNSQ